MKKFLLVVLAIVVIGFGYWLFGRPGSQLAVSPSPSVSATPHFDQSASDGVISFLYPSGDFGLAVSAEQLGQGANIPPCEEGFNYCLIYKSTTYDDTNFESAGLRIQKRPDLTTQQACLSAPPAGYAASTTPSATSSTNNYSTSVFQSVGDAAAGHYASGTLYRAFLSDISRCYEFEARIGQTQYANFPAGTIKEFTAADQADVNNKLYQLLNTVTLKSGEQIKFAQ